jgi:tripartite-type tricarboxylate transporter receptor subunit TctC
MNLKLILPALLSALVVSSAVGAQSYPSRPITLVVPYTPGTGIDIVARTIGPRLTERWNQPIVVDNKPGASGNLGADIVAKARPDGYTLMVTVITFAMTPGMSKTIPYDVVADFTPIAEAATGNMALVVSTKALQAETMKDLVAYARANPGKLNYASPGNGTPQHLGVELLKQQLNIDMVHVPYRGAAGAVTDLIAGQVQLAYLPVHTALPFAQNGQVRVLAVASKTRSILAPDAPSFNELGYSNMDIELWFGIYGPAKLPAEIVEKWNRDLPAILETPELKETWLKQGLVPAYAPSAAFTAFTKSEVAKWRTVVEKSGIQPD